LLAREIDLERAKPPNYRDVTVPMLIIAGEEDKSAPLAGCEFILGELGSPSKSLAVLKGVGHWHCVEAADEVAALVSAFLSRVVADGNWDNATCP
jgi:pimeloyl-ACP methyl ester carboxylesterase